MQTKFSTLEDVQGQYDWLKEMRSTHPVWLDEDSNCWHVFRYADVHAVSADYHTFSSERGQQLARRFTPNTNEQAPIMGRSILAMDPPQHHQYRGLVSSVFTPKAINRLADRIATITQELLDEVRSAGQMDLVTDIAYPLPTIVIAEMLGVPTSDRPLFQRWADGVLSRQLSDSEIFRDDGENLHDNPVVRRSVRDTKEMSDYFREMLEVRRQAPHDDMMSALLAAEVDGHHLSMEDTTSFCILLLLAGHITTTNLLSQAIRCFDEHPDAMERLRKQPELMPGAIEEVLRYASPVWRLLRKTTRDVTIGNSTIPKDAWVFLWLTSANRDEEQFAEPERFDIERTPNRHVAFGHGIHFCIGAPLARLEASIALPMMLKQLPNLRLSEEMPLELFEGRMLFGFKHLPVTFTTAA